MAARFLLTGKQYADVGEEWEQVETMPSGKQVRKRYKVHTLLDPDDSSQYNYPNQIIVALGADPQYPADLILRSAVNSEMQPLNAEAVKVFDRVANEAAAKQAQLPMGEAAFPTAFVARAEGDPLADIKRQLAELTGMVSTLQGENAELKHRLLATAEPEAETLEDVVVEDAPQEEARP